MRENTLHTGVDAENGIVIRKTGEDDIRLRCECRDTVGNTRPMRSQRLCCSPVSIVCGYIVAMIEQTSHDPKSHAADADKSEQLFFGVIVFISFF